MLLSKPAASIDISSQATANEWWHFARSQSPVGILVQVQAETDELPKPRITEILFYGTVAPPPAGILPAPLTSPHLHNGQVEQLPELRVHALPLSSHLLHDQDARPLTNDEAQFLPPLQRPQPAPTSPGRKRDIFDDATIASRKARGRGGKGVAAAAARTLDSQQAFDPRKSLLSNDDVASRPSARPASRSPSVSSDTRPMSRRGGSEAHIRRSNLSQVASPAAQSEEQTTESRNKEALSKVVMAAMRMHGLQQRKKTKPGQAVIRTGPEESQPLHEATPTDSIIKDDEYKLIYHQTFKGAVLALVCESLSTATQNPSSHK